MSSSTRLLETPPIPLELRGQAPRRVRRRASHGADWLFAQVLALGFALVVGWGLAKMADYAQWEATMWRDGIDANAVVTKVEGAAKTNAITYRFATAPGSPAVYRGNTSFPTGASAPSFSPGETIAIKYLPRDPNRNIATDQGDFTVGLLLWIAGLSLVMLLPLGSLWWVWRARQLVIWGTPIMAMVEKVTVNSTIGPNRKIMTLRAHFCWRDDTNRLRRSSMVTYVLDPPPQAQERAIALMSRSGKFAVIYDLCPFEAVE